MFKWTAIIIGALAVIYYGLAEAPDLVAAQFRDLFAWILAGKLRPRVSETFDLADAAKAMDLLKDPNTRSTEANLALRVANFKV